MSVQLSPRLLFALKVSRPLNSERTCGRPRMMTPDGSAEKCAVSLVAAKRLTVMPGIRWSASATDLSGNAPMSVAVIEFDHCIGVALDLLRRAERAPGASDDDGVLAARLGRGLRIRVGRLADGLALIRLRSLHPLRIRHRRLQERDTKHESRSAALESARRMKPSRNSNHECLPSDRPHHNACDRALDSAGD